MLKLEENHRTDGTQIEVTVKKRIHTALKSHYILINCCPLGN